VFEEDESSEAAARIERLLRELHEGER